MSGIASPTVSLPAVWALISAAAWLLGTSVTSGARSAAAVECTSLIGCLAGVGRIFPADGGTICGIGRLVAGAAMVCINWRKLSIVTRTKRRSVIFCAAAAGLTCREVGRAPDTSVCPFRFKRGTANAHVELAQFQPHIALDHLTRYVHHFIRLHRDVNIRCSFDLQPDVHGATV